MVAVDTSNLASSLDLVPRFSPLLQNIRNAGNDEKSRLTISYNSFYKFYNIIVPYFKYFQALTGILINKL